MHRMPNPMSNRRAGLLVRRIRVAHGHDHSRIPRRINAGHGPKQFGRER